MKTCLKSLVIKYRQTKPTAGYCFILLEVAQMKQTNNTRHWNSCGATGTLILLLVGMQDGTTTLQNAYEYF